jgi:hypothetical protein
VQTYERLLDVAGELLAHVDIERISTNLICARRQDAARSLSVFPQQIRGPQGPRGRQ